MQALVAIMRRFTLLADQRQKQWKGPSVESKGAQYYRIGLPKRRAYFPGQSERRAVRSKLIATAQYICTSTLGLVRSFSHSAESRSS